MNLGDLQNVLSLVSQGVMALMVLATVVVKITPTKSDDAKLAAIYDKIHTVMAWLPTLGVNPKTQELQDWYDKNKPA